MSTPTAPTAPLLRWMLRTLAVAATVMLAAHLLAGCGGGDPEDAAGPDKPTPAVLCSPGVCQ